MEVQNLTNYSLKLLSHTYWENKEQFDLNVDTYSNWQIFAVERGSFQYEIGNESGIASSDDIIICPPEKPFKRRIISPLALHFISCDVQNYENKKLSLPTVKVSPNDRVRLASNFSYLRRLHLSQDYRSIFRKEWILNDIWQLICVDFEVDPILHFGIPTPDSQDELMNKTAEWLLEHAFEPINLKEVAEKMELSPVQLTRRFKKSFKMTPSEFIKRLRMHRTAKLLLDTELTLEEISEKCGYENGFYLSRVFTNFMKVSPSKYREQNYL